MAVIIRGTTPTIKYTFKTVDIETITRAILTIKKNGSIIVRKELSEATIGEDTLSWKLSQADTLAGSREGAKVMLNWLTTDGTRGASSEVDVSFRDNHIPEVIA